MAAPETVEDFFSTALGRKGLATKHFKMKTMPNFLAVQVRRYYVAEDWTPKKLDVLVGRRRLTLGYVRCIIGYPVHTRDVGA